VKAAGDRPWRLAGALCGLLVVLDQAAKALVESRLSPGEDIGVLGPIELTVSHNNGIAFGLASHSGIVLALVAAAGLSFVGAILARHPSRPWIWVPVGLIAGGALGNLADRLRAGAVIDYIAIGPWPPFNLADVAITVGVALLAFSFLREADR
jgi:signal peptidase II